MLRQTSRRFDQHAFERGLPVLTERAYIAERPAGRRVDRSVSFRIDRAIECSGTRTAVLVLDQVQDGTAGE